MKYLLVFQLGGAIGLSTFCSLLLYNLNLDKKKRHITRELKQEQAKTQNYFKSVTEIYAPDGDPLDYGISRGLKVRKETIKIRSKPYKPCEWEGVYNVI